MNWIPASEVNKYLEVGDSVLVHTWSGRYTVGQYRPYDNLGFDWLTEAEGWTEVISFCLIVPDERK